MIQSHNLFPLEEYVGMTRQLLGSAGNVIFNLEEVASLLVPASIAIPLESRNYDNAATLSELMRVALSQVARAAQPWASVRNPFGIRGYHSLRTENLSAGFPNMDSPIWSFSGPGCLDHGAF